MKHTLRSNLGLQAASRLGALRKEKNITLKKLAAKTGLSEAYLSRLENFKAPISLDNLDVLASALEVPIELFFRTDSVNKPLTICRNKGGKKAKFRGSKGFQAHLLAEDKKRKFMEPLIVEVHTAHEAVPKKAHSGEEFNYVLEGSCEFLYGNQKYILEKDDSVYFDCAVPHAVRPIAKTPCRVLAVVGSDEYALHGNLKSLLNDE